MNKKYYLYWIHRVDHKDITKDGYVGVSYNTKLRFKQHKQDSKKNERPIHHALNKYEDISYDILGSGDKEYIYKWEYKLRPDYNIGWNVALGGNYSFLNVNKDLTGVLYNKILSTRESGKTWLEMSIIFNISKSTLGRICYGELEFLRDFESYRELEKVKVEYLTYNKQTRSISEWSVLLGVDPKTIKYRLSKGFSLRNVLTSKSHSIKLITYKGQTKSIGEWGKLTGIDRHTIHRRVSKNVPIDDIFSKKNCPLRITFNSKTQTLSAWARELGMCLGTLQDRMTNGWTIEEMLTIPPSSKNRIQTIREGK